MANNITNIKFIRGTRSQWLTYQESADFKPLQSGEIGIVFEDGSDGKNGVSLIFGDGMSKVGDNTLKYINTEEVKSSGGGGGNDTSVERLQYYGNKDIEITPESYFTINDTSETITGLTDEGKTQAELVIPYKIKNHYIKTIDDNAFKDNTILSKVILPKSIISINDHAFDGCTELTYINFPNTLTNIGKYAFNNTNLINIVIPESASYIDEYAFANCSNLEDIEIPKSLINISTSALNDSNVNLIVYCEQNSIAETFAKNNNYAIMYTDVNQLSHRNFALKSENNIPADIRAGDICFIWSQFDSSHDTNTFKAANYTNMPIGDDINTATTEYFGLIKGGLRQDSSNGLISADMEVAKTPSGTKIFFNKI